MKQIWSGHVTQAAVRYGEQVPVATACCNACRTCVQTNLVGLAFAGFAAAAVAVSRFARRFTAAA